jgi:predicted helicase
LLAKAQWMCDAYSALQGQSDRSFPESVKWSADLKTKFIAGRKVKFDRRLLVKAHWRPFARAHLYAEKVFNDRLTDNHFVAFGQLLNEANEVVMICGHPQIPFTVHAIDGLPDAGYSSRATQMFPRWVYDATGARHDNITDWALKQFQQHYHPGKGRKPAALNKEAIFHYVYAVLHDPLYRETYAQNLKREFPRIPLYGSTVAHFEQWAAWGAELMALHIGYETVEPWPVKRTDMTDAKARAANQSPKCILKSEPDAGRIVVDSETLLAGIPAEAWAYKLGNRSALDWVLDQHKERKPKDPTIREKFDTYRFADHKERVIALLARVARVSVETVRLVEALKAGPR